MRRTAAQALRDELTAADKAVEKAKAALEKAQLRAVEIGAEIEERKRSLDLLKSSRNALDEALAALGGNKTQPGPDAEPEIEPLDLTSDLAEETEEKAAEETTDVESDDRPRAVSRKRG